MAFFSFQERSSFNSPISKTGFQAMCRTLSFFRNIDSKSQVEFRARFRRYLIWDVIYCVIQLVEYIEYGNIGSFGGIFIITALLFAVDAVLMVWLLAVPIERTPERHKIHANTISNSITLVFYTISKLYFLFTVEESALSVLITIGLWCLLIPIKVMKVMIIHRYLQFCDTADAGALINEDGTTPGGLPASDQQAVIDVNTDDAADPNIPV